jgi:tetratricopeptide (TPR) repeat protein
LGLTPVSHAGSGDNFPETWGEHPAAVMTAAFSPDSTRVLTASSDDRARVWDAATGKLLTSPLQHQGEVLSAAFSPDGTHVLTATSDYRARVWDVRLDTRSLADWILIAERCPFALDERGALTFRSVLHTDATRPPDAAVAQAKALTRKTPTPTTTPTATMTEQVLLARLDKDFVAAQGRQAYVAAATIAQQLYDVQRKATGDDSAEALRRKTDLARMLNLTGAYPAALQHNKELLKTTEAKHGAESREVMFALQDMVSTYWQQNRYDEVDPIFQRMLAIAKKLDSENSLTYAGLLLQQGALLDAKNEFSSAQPVFEQCLRIEEAIYKKDNPTLRGTLQILAGHYWQTNQNAKAIAIYNRVIDLSTKVAGETALTLSIVATLYHDYGRDDLAKPLAKRAIALLEPEVQRREKANPDDPMIGFTLGQLGSSYRAMGDVANAAKVFERAIALDEKRTGFSAWLVQLAEIRRAQGKPKEAMALLEKASARNAQLSPFFATASNPQMADLARELGDVRRVEQLLTDYRAAAEKQFGKTSAMYGTAQLTIASKLMQSGKIPQAEAALTEALDLAERELANVLKTGTESDHAMYFARNGYYLDTALNFQINYAPNSPAAARLGLTTLLRRKGRVLDAATASLATPRSKLSPDDKQLLDDLASARAKLSKLTVAGPPATNPAAYARIVSAREDQIQKLEVAIGKRSASYRVVTQTVDFAAVQELVPKDARLVEIVNYQPLDPKASFQFNPTLKPRRYGAYVLAATGDAAFVDLGEAAPIDLTIEKFRKAVANPNDHRAGELGNALYKLTMAKIEPALGGATYVLVAPDGALNVVPFSALVDDKNEFLIKRYMFTYLSSGRDLLRLNVKTKAEGGGVIFADPSIDNGVPHRRPA